MGRGKKEGEKKNGNEKGGGENVGEKSKFQKVGVTKAGNFKYGHKTCTSQIFKYRCTSKAAQKELSSHMLQNKVII